MPLATARLLCVIESVLLGLLFFSSRRRHTRCSRDWSSDVCSSDLFIDPLGRTYAATRLETEASVADRLRTSDVIPLYVRLGDWVGLLVVLATIGFAGVLVADKWRSGRLL